MIINKIAIIDYEVAPLFKKEHLASIQKSLPNAELIYASTANELINQTNDTDVLITFPHVSEEKLKFCIGAPSLKLIHSVISGVDGLLNSEIRNLDVRITCTKGIHGYPMADHTLAFIYSFLRAFPMFFECQKKKKYVNELATLCDEATNKTIGIIGLGNIGLHIAQKCKQLGFKVLGLKRTPIINEWLDKCYATKEIDQLLKESDFVVVIVPDTPETHHLIGEKELRTMKPTAYLINIARGGVVDEEALIQVLKDKAIAGAGLDVFAEEPLSPDSPLWELPNVIITPHLAARSPYYMDRATKILIDNLQRYSRDEELLFEIDKTIGY